MSCSDLSSHKDLAVAILECFSSPSEEIKSAASFALGWFSILLFFSPAQCTLWDLTISLGHIFAAYLCEIYLPLVPGTFPCIALGDILALYPWDNHIPAKWDPTQWDLTISLGHVFPTSLCDIYLLLIAGTFPCISLGHIPALYHWDNHIAAKWDPTQWH